jgi:glycosyltransferase involved in cell wall biosynthesis
MNVLFNTYPHAFHTPGGGEMQLLNYQRYLAKLGVEVGMFNQWQPNFLDYDLVHFFSVMGGSIPFCHFVKQLKLPLVVTSSLWITEETKQLYPWQEIKQHLSLTDRVITNSKMESIQLHTVLGVPLEKCAVVYNGVDPLFFEKVSPDLFRQHFKIDYPFILNVANVEPRKNQLNLLKAMQQFTDHKLVTIGHIRDQAYADQCLALGGDQFVFLGPIPHHDPLLRSAYAACDVFALPSTLETPGLAAIEAAAQGATVVVTGVGAPREYFGEQVHYVDQPGSVDEIAAQLTAALSAPKTDVLAAMMRDRFGWERVVGELVGVYRGV